MNLCVISVIASLSKSLGRYLDDSLAIQPRLLEAHYHQAQAAASRGRLRYEVSVEATETCPDDHTEVRSVQETQTLLPNVRPHLTPGPQSRVGGVKPGAMDLVNSLLWTPGLLEEAIIVETDHSVNEALLVETREGEVAKPWYRLSPHLFGIICPEYLLGQVVLQHTGGLPNAGVDGGHCGKSSAATTRLLVLD